MIDFVNFVVFIKTEKRQLQNRAGVNQDEIQPGNMKIWSDPFQPLKKD